MSHLQAVVARLYVAKGITYTAGVARPNGEPLSDDTLNFLGTVVEIESR